ncbi:MAG: hypothetical protein IKG69_11675, partial [Atopobiaceae bacterium]|nr:hypothetical protein [Atopobiaceae bacterium]
LPGETENAQCCRASPSGRPPSSHSAGSPHRPKDPQDDPTDPDPSDPVPVDPVPVLEAEAPEDVVYNGGEQKEKPVVTDKKTGDELTENVDYKLSYSDDVTNVGEVTVTVTGIGAYAANDTIELTYNITPAPIEIITSGASKTYDGTPLTEPSYTIILNAGAENEVTITSTADLVTLLGSDTLGVDITGSQTLVGSSPNTFELTWADKTQQVVENILANAIPMLRGVGSPTAKSTNYALTAEVGTLEVTDDNVDPDLVVNKTHEGTDFAEGDTITFTLTAKNIYDDVATITFEEIEGVEIEQATFENVPAGETVTTTATYVVTKADIEAGEFKNTVTVTIKSGDRETTYEAEDTAKMAKPAPQPKKPELPQTGDPFDAAAIVYMLAAGVASMAAGLRARRRRWEEER